MNIVNRRPANRTEGEDCRPVIVAASIQTALGNLDATWNGLMNGITGLRPGSFVNVETDYPVGRVDGLPGPAGSTERLENLIKACLADLPDMEDFADSCDIIAATTKGAADELLEGGEKLEGQAWQVGRIFAERLSCPSRPTTLSAACASGTVALIEAGIRIRSGSSNVVLVAGIDLLSSFVVAGFDALQGLSPTPCRPFDAHRDGLSLGEGAGLLIIASQQFALEHKLDILAHLDGWGVSCDGVHITAPCRHGTGLQRVLAQTTGNGKVMVGAVNAHGTGTIYNDAMEMTSFAQFWHHPPPFHSIKGAVGHCLGAAGIIETGIGLLSLRHGTIPPTVGLQEKDRPEANLSGETPLALEAPSILCCNSGFGGINAAVLLTSPDL